MVVLLLINMAASLPQLNLFTEPPRQLALEGTRYQEILPISTDYSDTIEFIIPNKNNFEMLDPAGIYFEVGFKIQNKAGADITKEPSGDGKTTFKYSVTPINNFLHSLFAKVALYINNNQVTSIEDNYAYRSYFENLLSYDEDTQKTQMFSTVLWAKDDAGYFDTVELDSDPAKFGTHNEGALRRFSRLFWDATNTTTQKVTKLVAKPHCDMFFQNRYIPFGAELKLRFIRNDDKFCLLYANNDAQGPYQVKIETFKMYAKYAKLSPPIFNAAEAQLRKGNRIKYPIRRVEVKSSVMPSGVYNYRFNNIIQGQLPRRIVMGFVENDTFNGKKEANPFYFKHFDVEELKTIYNGKQIPETPLKFNYNIGDYQDGYLSLFKGTGRMHKDVGQINITYDDYRTGYAIYCLDYTADFAGDTDSFTPYKEGQFDIDVTFRTPLAEPTNLILYAEFDNIVELDYNRNVYKNY